MMRIIRAVAFAVASVTGGNALLNGQGLDASQVLASARAALGGENNLTAVKSFVATGRTRQLRGNNLVPVEFEISCELPDRCVRRDEIPAQNGDVILSGFQGDSLIQFPSPPPGRAGGPPGPPPGRPENGAPAGPQRGTGPAGDGRGAPPSNPAAQRLNTIRQDFARLTLGAFATSFSSYPLTFTYAAEGEAPEGKADILDVAGPANFAARLVVQRDTHLPVMLVWQVPVTNVILRVPGQPPPDPLPPGSLIVDAPAPPASTASQAERDEYAAAVAARRQQAMAQARPVEYRMYYADYRAAGNLKWPFRVRRAVAGTTIEETTFDRIRINVKIDARKFEVPK
jgi:hypothetical protein